MASQILSPSLVIAEPGPEGELPSGMFLWLDAERGVNTSGITVTSWEDQSSNGLTVDTITNTPISNSNGLNFKSSVYFIHNEQIDSDSVDIGDSHTVFVVADTSYVSGDTLFQHTDFEDFRMESSGFRVGDNTFHNYGDLGYGSTTIYGQPSVSSIAYTRGALSQGSLNGLSTEVTAGTELDPGSAPYQIFDSSSVNSGEITEIITYDRHLSASEIAEVETYLTFKYGISLDQTTPRDYVASDGVTKMWDSSVDTDYNHNIFGIGRDDGFGIDARVAKSETSGDQPVVSLDRDFLNNNDHISRETEHDNDLQFLTISDNGADFTSQATELDTSIYSSRIAREWQVQKTDNFDQPVYLYFSGYGIYNQVLVDDDGDFSSGAQSVGYLKGDGSILIDFEDGQYFALATTIWPTDYDNFGYEFPNAFDLSELRDINQTLDVAHILEEEDMQGIAFNENGSKLYVTGLDTDAVHEFTLSTPFNINTATLTYSLDISDEIENVQGISFGVSKGRQLYVVGYTDDDYGQLQSYDLPDPYSLAGAVPVDYVPLEEESDPSGIIFSGNGDRFYIAGDNEKEVIQYTLATYREVDSIVSTYSLDVSESGGDLEDIAFNNDGSRLFVLNKNNQEIEVYTLSTEYDLSTATPTALIPIPDASDESARGMAFNDNGMLLYIADKDRSQIRTYQIPGYIETEENDGTIETEDQIRVWMYAEDDFNDGGTGFLTSSQFDILNLPDGLTAVAEKGENQDIFISFSGAATSHQNVHDLSNLQFSFDDSAFYSNNASYYVRA